MEGAADEPDRKRPRVEMEADAGEWSEHPSLYLEDGNVILKPLRGTTLFRVHKSYLSRSSPVFQDLLSPRADVKPELMRDCELLRLDDGAEEIEAMLRLMYDGLQIDFPEITVENFPLLSDLLRVTTKYGMDRHCTELLKRLGAEWPAALAAHDAKDASDAPELIVHPATAIALLRETGHARAELLVPLFYDLSRRSWQFGGGHHLAPLAHADIERLVVGQNALHREQFRMLDTPHHILAQPPPGMNEQVHARCRAALTVLWQRVATTLTKQTSESFLCSPIEDWKRLGVRKETVQALGACPECAEKVSNYVEAKRLVLWNGLKGMFQL